MAGEGGSQNPFIVAPAGVAGAEAVGHLSPACNFSVRARIRGDL